MAVVDQQDNFSNISWHSDSNQQPSGFSGRSDDGSPPPILDVEPPSAEDQRHGEQLLEEDPGMSGDVLECLVSEPRKESDGTKDAFVSYLVTTNVSIPQRLALLQGIVWHGADTDHLFLPVLV